MAVILRHKLMMHNE